MFEFESDPQGPCSRCGTMTVVCGSNPLCEACCQDEAEEDRCESCGIRPASREGFCDECLALLQGEKAPGYRQVDPRKVEAIQVRREAEEAAERASYDWREARWH